MEKTVKIKYINKNTLQVNEIEICLEQNIQKNNLKKTLKQFNIFPYNGKSKYLNCKGIGSCGTCAVSVLDFDGNKIYSSKDEYIGDLTKMEKIRLNFFPHTLDNSFEKSLRLSCQYKIKTDLMTIKNNGFWGNE